MLDNRTHTTMRYCPILLYSKLFIYPIIQSIVSLLIAKIHVRKELDAY